jgi:hypothetical protein
MATIILRGAAKIAAYLALVRAGHPLPYPKGRDAIAARAVLRRLESAGAIVVDPVAQTYARKPGVSVRFHQPLADRLAAGPLHSSEWRDVAKSPNSLRVQIAHLRARGWDIASIPDRRGHDRASGRLPVRYELRT